MRAIPLTYWKSSYTFLCSTTHTYLFEHLLITAFFEYDLIVMAAEIFVRKLSMPEGCIGRRSHGGPGDYLFSSNCLCVIYFVFMVCMIYFLGAFDLNWRPSIIVKAMQYIHCLRAIFVVKYILNAIDLARELDFISVGQFITISQHVTV